MHNKNKSEDITAEYGNIAQGPLVGRGNEVLTRAEDIKGNKKEFSNSIETPPLEEVEHGEKYGNKEYHGM